MAVDPSDNAHFNCNFVVVAMDQIPLSFVDELTGVDERNFVRRTVVLGKRHESDGEIVELCGSGGFLDLAEGLRVIGETESLLGVVILLVDDFD